MAQSNHPRRLSYQGVHLMVDPNAAVPGALGGHQGEPVVLVVLCGREQRGALPRPHNPAEAALQPGRSGPSRAGERTPPPATPLTAQRLLQALPEAPQLLLADTAGGPQEAGDERRRRGDLGPHGHPGRREPPAAASPARCQRRRARPAPAPRASGQWRRRATTTSHGGAPPRPPAEAGRSTPHWRRRARGGASSATAGGHWAAGRAGPCLFCWRRGGTSRGTASTSNGVLGGHGGCLGPSPSRCATRARPVKPRRLLVGRRPQGQGTPTRQSSGEAVRTSPSLLSHAQKQLSGRARHETTVIFRKRGGPHSIGFLPKACCPASVWEFGTLGNGWRNWVNQVLPST